jgi:hypothetical protein
MSDLQDFLNINISSIEIGDWLPPIGSEPSLDLYLKGRREIFSQSFFGERDWLIYESALERHFGRMEKFKSSNGEVFQNLVYGNIQSGKTAHLLANICWAKDNGLDLVILFSGATTPLNDQTTERLKSDLPEGTAIIESVPTETSEPQLVQLSVNLHRHISDRSSSANSPIPVLIMLKNPNRLSAMESIQNRLQDRFDNALSVMVIDDEADQASPDATLRARGVASPRNRTTHTGISRLSQEILGKRYYLSYTATPQALLLGSLNNFLQPQFCSVIPSGSDYVGIADVVKLSGVLVTTDEMSFLESNLSEDEVNAAALENLLAEFTVICWIHRKHVGLFHSGTEIEHICSLDSVQMLIHPSAQQLTHKVYIDQIAEITRMWIREMRDSNSRNELFKSVLFPAYRRVLARFSPEAFATYVTENSIDRQSFFNDYVSHLSWSLRVQGKLQVLEVNSNQRGALRREGRERDFLPNKSSEWAGKDWILVGGEILGRGLTIPHLAITLFLRNPSLPNFDTSLQQMRFCGYRRSYSSILRVCAPGDIVQDYQYAAIIERQLRKVALRWDVESRNLILDPPLIRFEAPSDSRYRPTRTGVTSVEVFKKDVTRGFFAFRQVLNPATLQSNLSFLRTWMDKGNNGLQTIDSFRVFDFAAPAFIEFSKGIVAVGGDKSNFNSFIELLEDGPMEDLDCKLVVDENLDLIPISGAQEFLDRFENDNGIFYNRSISNTDPSIKLDWKSGDTEDLERVKIRTVVGVPERKVPDLFPNSTVIHVRAFQLFEDALTRSGYIGWGLSFIGWVPPRSHTLWIHEGAAGDE